MNVNELDDRIMMHEIDHRIMMQLIDPTSTVIVRRLMETVEMEEQEQREVIIIEEVRNTEEATNAEEVLVKPKKPTKRSRN